MKSSLFTRSPFRDTPLFALSLAVLALVVIVGLARRGTVSAPSPINLVFTQWWVDELEPGTLEEIVGEFEAACENVKVTLDTCPREEVAALLAEYGVRKKNGAEGGSEDDRLVGDIAAFDPRWNNVIDESVFLEKAPLAAFLHPLFYNIDLLRDAGFTRPPKTRSEFIKMCRTIKKDFADVYGIAFADDPYDAVLPWLVASGETTDILRRVAGNFPQELVDTGLLAPSQFTETSRQVLDRFIREKIAMMIGSTADIRKIRALAPDMNFGITTVPPPDSYVGKPVFSQSTWYAAVLAGTENAEAARAFLAFLRENRGRLALASGAVPGDIFEDEGGGESFAEAASLDADPLFAKARNMYEGGECVAEEKVPLL